MSLARRESPLPTIVDRLTAIVVRATFSDEALTAGREAVAAGRVSRPSLGPTKADAAVADGGRVVRVRLFWSGENLGASCGCRQRHCAHAAALALLLIGVARPEEEDGLEEPASSLREEERRRREARGSSELFEIERHGGTAARASTATIACRPRRLRRTGSPFARSTRRTTAARVPTSRRTSSAPASTSRPCSATCAPTRPGA